MKMFKTKRDYGKALKFFRVGNGNAFKIELSQSTVAKHLSVSRQTISNWETNTSTPTVDHLTGIVSLFGINFKEFLDKALEFGIKKEAIDDFAEND